MRFHVNYRAIKTKLKREAHCIRFRDKYNESERNNVYCRNCTCKPIETEIAMLDKRNVDDLSIEELERILAVKKREARQQQLHRMRASGRVINTSADAPTAEPSRQPDYSDADGLPAATVEISSDKLTKRKIVPQFEDAIDMREYKPKSNAGRIWRMFVDRSLLLAEIAAVIGLIGLGMALFNGLNILEQETAAAQAAAEAQRRAGIPTIAPTPQLTLENVVLPTGHIFQNNQPVFNFGEIPENMRGLVVNQVYLPPDIARVPTTDDTPLRVIIPDINVDKPIVQGVDWNALQQGVGMLPNGAVPTSDRDNVVLAAHNDIYGEIFADLDQLNVGDRLQMQTGSDFFTYQVREILYVEPDAVHVMESQGVPMVTLISCYPPRVNNQRIIVYADRVDL